MPIRILHSVTNMARGGIETMLMNYYRHIDRNLVQFDFLCNKNVPGAYDEEIRQLGGRIFITPGLNPLKFPAYLRYMKSLFREHPEYRIVHAHNGAFGVYALYAARKAGIPHRIFHAHGAGHTLNLKLPWKLFCISQLLKNANHYWTCGVAAAECYFGRNNVITGHYTLIRNAIDPEQFRYDEQVRQRIRRQYHWDGKCVVGHVGRFAKQKNHRFIIRLFKILAEKDKSAFLVLLGDGELLESVRKQVSESGLQDRVLFALNVNNTNEWYQAFDLFLLPSHWEGLPVTGIEAQAAGLPCLFSDRVTQEVKIADQVTFLNLEKPLEEWADAVMDLLAIKERPDHSALLTSAGYNIEVEAKKLQDLYLGMENSKQ